jgi:hypothetical protein
VVVEGGDGAALESGTPVLEVRLWSLTGSRSGAERHFTLRAGERAGPQQPATFDLLGESPYVGRLDVRNVTSSGVPLDLRGIWLDPLGTADAGEAWVDPRLRVYGVCADPLSRGGLSR